MSRQRTPWLIGWEAAKANAAPAFVLQSMMLAILLAYYFHPPSAAFLNALAGFKERHGLAFVLIASAIVGAILPSCSLSSFFSAVPFGYKMRAILFLTHHSGRLMAFSLT